MSLGFGIYVRCLHGFAVFGEYGKENEGKGELTALLLGRGQDGWHPWRVGWSLMMVALWTVSWLWF